MKRISFFILLIVFAAVIFFVLRSNKNKLALKQKISESQVQQIPVRIDTVKRRMMGELYAYAGIMNPEKELMVVSQTQGEVVRVLVKVGDHVTKGQELVKVDDDILQANLLVAEANYEKAQKDLRRFENMIEQDGITQDQLEKMSLNLKNAEANYVTLVKRIEQASIKAPFEGYINQLFTKEGAMLGPGIPVFEIVDIRRFKVSLNVTEEEILGIQKGMQARIIPKAVDSIRLNGTVSTRAISANMAQQYAVEVIAENTYPGILKGGMMARVDLIPLGQEKLLSIPAGIIRESEGASFVYKVSGNKAEKAWITTGRQNNTFIEIIGGLVENDLVVTTGIDQITDGQEIRIIQK
jgi:membrane fusion protein (multidrug efflux system)